jgi:CelD/BcsL family acetyltransferase involved in cellulose biosynthesis
MEARVVSLRGLTDEDLAGWTGCAAAALEPNPFLEPDWLLPAIAHLGESPTARLVMVGRDDTVHAVVPVADVVADEHGAAGHEGHAALLTRVAPTAVALGTPLVTADGGLDAVSCLLTALVGEAGRSGSGLVIMEWLGNDGPVAGLLRGAASRTGHHLIEFDGWERGLLRRRDGDGDGDGEPYWLRGIGKNRRRTIRQHRTHLEEALGAGVAVRRRVDGAAVDEFLALEGSGWKGHELGGLAFGRQQCSTQFFEDVCRRYLRSGRMWFLSLEGPDAPVAMVCFVRSGRGVFAYRTAYDEAFAKYGPGVEVFLAAMEQFVQEDDAGWLDTCSAPGNTHLLGLFPDRHAMATFMVRVPTAHSRAAPDD